MYILDVKPDITWIKCCTNDNSVSSYLSKYNSCQLLKNPFLTVLCTYILQSSFVGAIAIGDLVKSTLGPKGMVSTLVQGLCDLVEYHRHIHKKNLQRLRRGATS